MSYINLFGTPTHPPTLKRALPWLNGCENLWPQSRSCCSPPQSEDLQAAGETHIKLRVTQRSVSDHRGSSTLFLNLGRKKKGETTVTEKLWMGWCGDMNTADAATHSGRRDRRFATLTGVNYLLKTGPDLLSFCSSAMFAPLFSKREEKVQVRNKKKGGKKTSRRGFIELVSLLPCHKELHASWGEGEGAGVTRIDRHCNTSCISAVSLLLTASTSQFNDHVLNNMLHIA